MYTLSRRKQIQKTKWLLYDYVFDFMPELGIDLKTHKAQLS